MTDIDNLRTYDVQPANGDPIVVYNGETANCLGTGFESFEEVARYVSREMPDYATGDLDIFTLGAMLVDESDTDHD